VSGRHLFRLAIVVQITLTFAVGAATTAHAQTADDGGTMMPSRLPAVVDTLSYDAATPDQADTPDYALPYSPDVSARLQRLADQLQEERAMTERLQQQLDFSGKPSAGTSPKVKKYVIGSSIIATGKFLPDGLTFSTANQDFMFHLGGLAQLDDVSVRNNNPGITSVPSGAGTTDAVDFRRLRFRAEGIMYENIDWISEFDFAAALQNTNQLDATTQSLGLRSFPASAGLPGNVQAGNTIDVVQATNVFMSFKNVPIFGNIRVGQHPDWFGMEHIESVRFTDFMERATIMDAYFGPYNNGYTPGISAFNISENKKANWMFGIYKNNAYDSGYTYDLGDHNWTYNARSTWTPYYDEVSNGRYLVHLGFGAEYRTFNTNTSATQGFDNVRLRSRGDLRNVSSQLCPAYADTGNFFTQAQTMFDPEFALQWGSFMVQAEWVSSYFNGAYTAQPGTAGSASLGKNAYTQGGYVEALYFLTGESRVYNRQSGVFVRTIPLENAFSTRGGGYGWGAWQIGARYDWLDLNTQGGAANLNGGNEQDITLGLNWFLNPNARFMINGVGTWVNNAASFTAPGTVGALNGSRFVGDGTILAFGSRMDFNF
jgi:phosphate-selective porin OprO/OprP